MNISAPMHNLRICFVNCGLPGDQCACFRAHMQKIYADLQAGQRPLLTSNSFGPEFEKAWSENIESLYES